MGCHYCEPQLNDMGTVPFQLNAKVENDCKMLNDTIGKDPMMALHEEGDVYALHPESSNSGVGVVISQKQQDRETRVIAFWS